MYVICLYHGMRYWHCLVALSLSDSVRQRAQPKFAGITIETWRRPSSEDASKLRGVYIKVSPLTFSHVV